MEALYSVPMLLAAQSGGESMITMGITFGAVILIFYFLIIRPQNKKQKALEKMLADIKKGDKVVTIGGLRGVVQSVSTDTVTIKVDEGSTTTLEFNKNAVANLLNPPAPKKDKEDKKAAKDNKKAEKTADIQPADKI